MNTEEPELSALITILRSVGPILGQGRHRPIGVADRARLGQKIRLPPGIELGLHLPPPRQQALALGTEFALQLDDERDRLRRHHPLIAGLDRTFEFDALRQGDLRHVSLHAGINRVRPSRRGPADRSSG
jgi:hypothetical protein